MTPADELNAVRTEIRRAVAAGSYAGARALLARHGACLEAMARSLPPGDPHLVELRSQAQSFFEWVRRMALAGRTHMSEQAQRLPQLSRYAAPDEGGRPSGLRLDA